MTPVNLIPHSNCREYVAWHNYMLDPKESAVFEIPYWHEDTKEFPLADQMLFYMSANKRNELRRSIKYGYSSREITWTERTNYLSDIHAINTSKHMRQNKAMGEEYLKFPKEVTGGKTCEHHYGTFIGCFDKDGRLRAYITTNFCGEMAAASQILGHGEYLRDHIMVNIWHEFVRICIERGIKYIVYSRWDDGWEGLRLWKKSVGMRAEVLTEKI
jgi:hypothetical protein